MPSTTDAERAVLTEVEGDADEDASGTGIAAFHRPWLMRPFIDAGRKLLYVLGER